MKRKRIGLVDLDTSHPASFIPIMREMGFEITTVYDGGTVHPEGYAYQFARDHDIPVVAKSLEEVVEQVDIAFIHSCDWELHIERAKPFVEAGIPIFVDKPIAGSPRHLDQFVQWVESGAIITGGSSLRVSDEVRAWQEKAIPREEWVYGMAGCAIDEFNYGIHAYAMVQGLLGPGIRGARHLGWNGGQRQVELEWEDGRRCIVNVGQTSGYLPFYANLVTQKRVHTIQTDNSKLYRALLASVMPYLAKTTPHPPIPFRQLVEIELAALAAKISETLGSRFIALSEIPMDYAGYNGPSFASAYKASKYPIAGGISCI